MRDSVAKAYFGFLLAILFTCGFLSHVNANVKSPMIWTSPTHSLLFSVYMVSANNGWAVGAGTIIHWDGNNWSNVTSPTANWLESVFMLRASDGWAVGGFPDGGSIVHWDGSSWKNVACPTPNRLHSVFMVSADDGWAVGDGGTIICWDGSNWKTVTCPTTDSLGSVSMVNADDGWAVGGPGTSTGASGSIIHWDGNSWSNGTIASPLFSGPNGWGLYSVFMLNSDNGWAVGCHNSQDASGAIAHWNGTCWSNGTGSLSNELFTLKSIYMISNSDGWTVSRYFGYMFHWDGSNWTRVTCPNDWDLNGVFMLSSTDGWAVGENGLIIRWNGTQWIPEFTLQVFILLPIIFVFVMHKRIKLKARNCLAHG